MCKEKYINELDRREYAEYIQEGNFNAFLLVLRKENNSESVNMPKENNSYSMNMLIESSNDNVNMPNENNNDDVYELKRCKSKDSLQRWREYELERRESEARWDSLRHLLHDQEMGGRINGMVGQFNTSTNGGQRNDTSQWEKNTKSLPIQNTGGMR